MFHGRGVADFDRVWDPTNGVARRAVLGGHGDPGCAVDDLTVDRLLTADPADYLRHARGYLDDIAHGRARLRLPPKQVYDARGGSDFRVMPCVVDGPQGLLQTVKLVGTNRRQRDLPGQITVGQVYVLDPDECYVSHCFDACLLSSARTGLCAALAVERLATAWDRVLIVGAGRVGYYAARYLAALGGMQELLIGDVDEGRARACAGVLRDELPQIAVRVAQKPPGEFFPVTVLATTASVPFWPVARENARVLAVSLGADARGQHELMPGWAGSELYTDTVDSLACGDLGAWRAAGLLHAAPPDLLAVVRTPPPPARRPRAFISTGSALLDNLTCAYLLARLD